MRTGNRLEVKKERKKTGGRKRKSEKRGERKRKERKREGIYRVYRVQSTAYMSLNA